MTDLFVMLLTFFFVMTGLYTATVVYIVKMLRRLEDKVRMTEEVLR